MQENNEKTAVYAIGAYDSNAWKSGNPYSGVYEADTSKTLDNNGGNPACNQGGMVIVENIRNDVQENGGVVINTELSTAWIATTTFFFHRKHQKR